MRLGHRLPIAKNCATGIECQQSYPGVREHGEWPANLHDVALQWHIDKAQLPRNDKVTWPAADTVAPSTAGAREEPSGVQK